MPGNSLSFNDIFGYTVTLMTTHSGMFEAYGLTILKYISLSLLVYFVTMSGLSGYIHWDKFVRLAVAIVLVKTMLVFYSAPLPMAGCSLYHLITDETAYFSNTMNGAISSQVMERLYSLYRGMETPSIAAAAFNAVEVVRWLITVVLLLAAAASIYMVIGLSFVFQGVLIMLGPIFIPWFLVPSFTYVAWGWLKALIVTSFIQVFGSAYLYVMGSLLINTVDRMGTDLSGGQIAIYGFTFPIILVSFAVGMFCIPRLTSDTLAGSGGYNIRSWF